MVTEDSSLGQDQLKQKGARNRALRSCPNPPGTRSLLARLPGDVADALRESLDVGDRDDFLTFTEALQNNALRCPPALADVRDAHADGRSGIRDEHELVALVDEDLIDDRAELLRAGECLDALPAPAGMAILIDRRPLTVALRRHEQDFLTIRLHDVHRGDRIPRLERDGTDAPGRAPHGADVGLAEVNGHALARRHDDVALPVGEIDGQELVALRS